jgi:hypothetical protein
MVVRTTLLVLSCLSVSVLNAQSKFTVNGRMKVEAGDLSGAKVVVYRNGAKERTVTQDLSKFSMELDMQQNYILSFEKEGFVTKKIAFNTRVPGDAVNNTFVPFDFAVSIFKQYDDVNIVVFNQPVGIIRYEPGSGDFDYDTDYTASIQSQLQEALAAVERKQKEEKAKAAADAKMAAKAEAEARKAEEQASKAERARAEAARREAQQKEKEAEAQRIAEEASRARSVERTMKTPPPPVAAPTSNVAKPVEGADQRQRVLPTVHVESQPTPVGNGSDLPPFDEEVVRNEELVVESNRVITVVKLERGGVVTEFRKVYHKWGGTFYFKNGAPCSQLSFDMEARSEQIAGTTTR